MSFPKKAFVFSNNRISEARICCQCWFKKISWKRKTKQQKKLRGNVFPLSPRSHAKIDLIWARTKICPKKSLTSFLQEALQKYPILFFGQMWPHPHPSSYPPPPTPHSMLFPWHIFNPILWRSYTEHKLTWNNNIAKGGKGMYVNHC